jgi:flavin reductase (DIM6/NTAB) family NADH-FMN oxidoreductase RutF
MAAESRLVGPIPDGADPETYDRLRRRILWSMPSGLYVLGTRSARGRNLMTLNWATQVSMDPKLLAVSVETGAVSHGLLHDGRVFSLNILPRDQRAIVRKFVKPLDDDGDPDQLAGFALRPGVTGAPILAVAAAWLDCEVRHHLLGGSHTLFVGEIVGCGGDPADGLEVLRMEDTRMSYGG